MTDREIKGQIKWLISTFLETEKDIKGKKIAICPFGNNGIWMKQMMNWGYGIVEDFIIDNEISRYNADIYCVEDLRKMDGTNLVVLLNTTDERINHVLEESIRKTNGDITIRNILKPFVIDASEKQAYFNKVREVLKVRKCKNKRLIRVGNEYDGGYVMCDDFKDAIIYSFGIGWDVSWDSYFAKHGYKVYMYDPTIDKLPYEHDLFHFEQYGIAGVDFAKDNMLSMGTILKMNGHENCKDIVMKIDVEGAEWDFINETPSELLDNFKQITFELHSLTDVSQSERKLSALSKITQTHQAVWVHGNNSVYAERAGSIIMPCNLEVTFLNKAKYCFEGESICFPIDLDRPNSRLVEEIELGCW